MTAYPGFSREALELIHLYESYGWTFTVSSKGHAIGHAPTGGETCSISRRLAPNNRAHQNALAAFRRWEREHTKEQSMPPRHGHIKHEALKALEHFHPYVMDVLADTPISERHAVLVPVPVEPEPVPVPVEPTPEPVPSGLGLRDSDRTRAPWIASRGARRGYESKAVVEVRAGDEVVGYECAGCGKAFDDPHTTASHYRRAHSFRKGRAEQNPTIEAPEDYHPSERLIRALMQFLDEHIPAGAPMGDEEVTRRVAEEALTWIRTRPDLPDPQPREPLTDTQIVERIRRLVTVEDHTEELDVLTRDLEASEEQVIALTRQLAEVQARADAIQADLDVWLSLAPRAQS